MWGKLSLGVAAVAMASTAQAKSEGVVRFQITSRDLGGALNQFAQQSGYQIVFADGPVRGKTARQLHGAYTPQAALGILLRGSGLTSRSIAGNIIVINAPAVPRQRSEVAPKARYAAAQPAPPAELSASSDGVDEIIVSAQRRNERLQDVPITIANISADQMRQANVRDLSDIAKITAGVRFDARVSYVQPTIRGVGTSIVVAGSGANVGMYQDGFYSPALQSSDFQLMNIENIQVLKGPQGTLFGRNTMGGAVLVNTSKPSTETKAIAEVAYGSYNAQRYQTYVTTGLTDTIAVDLAAMLSRGDGWVTNIYNGDDEVGKYERLSIRAGVNIDLTDDVSFLFRYNHSTTNDPTGILQAPYVLNGAPACTACTQPGAIFSTNRKEISADERLAFRRKANIVQVTGTADLGFASLRSYTQYRDEETLDNYYSLDYTNLPRLALNVLDNNKTFTQEFLLTSHPGQKLQWTAGLFYFNWKSSFPFVGVSTNVQNPVPANYARSARSGTTSVSYAAFADLTYEVSDRLFLTGGLRYTRDAVKDAFFQQGAAATVFLPTLKTSRTTPRAVIRYEPTNNSSIYASVTQGYKAAIYNVGSGSRDPIKPESLWAYEVGYKLASSDMSFNISGYYYDYKDQQLSASRVIGGQFANIITNAASAEIYGIDADLIYRFSDNLQVNLAANWSHARYKEFTNAPHFTVTNGLYLLSPIDASGGRVTRSPDFSASGGVTYSTVLAGGRLSLSGNGYYTSKVFYDLAEQIPQKAYATLELRAEWTDPSDRFTFALSGKNVTDTRYTIQGGLNTFGIGAVYAAPATVEGSIRIKI